MRVGELHSNVAILLMENPVQRINCHAAKHISRIPEAHMIMRRRRKKKMSKKKRKRFDSSVQERGERKRTITQQLNQQPTSDQYNNSQERKETTSRSQQLTNAFSKEFPAFHCLSLCLHQSGFVVLACSITFLLVARHKEMASVQQHTDLDFAKHGAHCAYSLCRQQGTPVCQFFCCLLVIFSFFPSFLCVVLLFRLLLFISVRFSSISLRCL